MLRKRYGKEIKLHIRLSVRGRVQAAMPTLSAVTAPSRASPLPQRTLLPGHGLHKGLLHGGLITAVSRAAVSAQVAEAAVADAT